MYLPLCFDPWKEAKNPAADAVHEGKKHISTPPWPLKKGRKKKKEGRKERAELPVILDWEAGRTTPVGVGWDYCKHGEAATIECPINSLGGIGGSPHFVFFLEHKGRV